MTKARWPGEGAITYEEARELQQPEIDERIKKRYQELLETEGKEVAQRMRRLATQLVDYQDSWITSEQLAAIYNVGYPL